MKSNNVTKEDCLKVQNVIDVRLTKIETKLSMIGVSIPIAVLIIQLAVKYLLK